MIRILFLLLTCISLPSIAQNAFKYQHILITNDDGIEDYSRLMALAKHVKQVAAHVTILVADTDRSGYSNFSSLGKNTSSLEIKCLSGSDSTGIDVYTTSGTPADCVLISILGLFPEDTPDLVLSGINGGTNEGSRWFQSGTIGAVRMATYLGVKGIAFSGFEDHRPDIFEKIPAWITEFITSPAVPHIDRYHYLTVAFPAVPLDQYRGTIVAGRKIAYDEPAKLAKFTQAIDKDPHQTGRGSSWTLQVINKPKSGQPKTDVEFLREGYIVISAMTIDENDHQLDRLLKEVTLPEF